MGRRRSNLVRWSLAIMGVFLLSHPALGVDLDLWEGFTASYLPEIHKARRSVLLDADGDGDLDLFVATGGRLPNRLFLNDGGGRFLDRSDLLPPVWDETREVVATDLDGDGRVDLYVDALRTRWLRFSAQGRILGPGPYVLFNEGRGRFRFDQSPALLARGRDAISQLAVAENPDGSSPEAARSDLDGDGIGEVVTVGAGGRAFVLLDGGRRRVDLPAAGAVSSGRMDRGEDAFFLSAKAPPFSLSPRDYGLLVIRMDGGRLKHSWLPGLWKWPVRVAAGDLNADGMADLVCTPDGGRTVTILLARGPNDPWSPWTAPPADAGGPAVLMAPVEPVLWDLDRGADSKADWHERLKANAGHATFVPLGSFDPRRDLLVHVPGLGMTYRDIHALQALSDTYQVVIGVCDQRSKPGIETGQEMARALVGLLRFREELARELGVRASSDIRLIGHSFGVIVTRLMLRELVESGELGDSGQGLLGKVLYVPIDGPWRGYDTPWITTAGKWDWPFRKLSRGAAYLLSMGKANRAALSTANRAPTMDGMHDRALPPDEVRMELVTVIDGPRTGAREPVDNWYGSELGSGELERLWSFLRSESTDLNRLDSWASWRLTRRQALQNLFRALQADHDFARHAGALRQAAHDATTPEAFAASYDAIVGRIADTFQGQHTEFMWNDGRFMPYLRELLRTGLAW